MHKPCTLMRAALACFCAVSPLPASAQLEQWTLERTVTIGDAFDPETGLTRVGDVIVMGDRLFVTQDFGAARPDFLPHRGLPRVHRPRWRRTGGVPECGPNGHARRPDVDRFGLATPPVL